MCTQRIKVLPKVKAPKKALAPMTILEEIVFKKILLYADNKSREIEVSVLLSQFKQCFSPKILKSIEGLKAKGYLV